MLVFVIVGGARGAVALAFVGVAVIGTFGITMVMAQQYLPTRIGMASGLSIGFSIGLGGIAAVILGADRGLDRPEDSALRQLVGPVVAAVLTTFLPRERGPARSSPRSPCLE